MPAIVLPHDINAADVVVELSVHPQKTGLIADGATSLKGTPGSRMSSKAISLVIKSPRHASSDDYALDHMDTIRKNEWRAKEILPSAINEESRLADIMHVESVDVDEMPWEQRSLTVRERIYDFCDHYAVFRVIDVVQAILAVISIILYLEQTYGYTLSSQTFPYVSANSVEIGFGSFFIADFLFSLYLAPSRRDFLLSMHAWIDILTIVPIFASLSVAVGSSHLYFFGFFRILRITRLLRLLKLPQFLFVAEHSFRYQLILVAFNIFCLVFCVTGLLETLEQDLKFHEAFYLICITITTVGYGDYSPKTTQGQFLILGLLVVSILFIPGEISKLQHFLAKNESSAKYIKRKDFGHVIVCGDFSAEDFVDFLLEFFHGNHGKQQLDVVLLRPEDSQTPRFNELIKLSVHGNQVTHIHGSPMHESDLDRARLTTAKACFFLQTRTAQPPLLEALAVTNRSPGTPVFASTMLDSGAEALRWACRPAGGIVTSLQEMGDLFTVRNVFAPGASTLLVNLCRSFAYVKKSVYDRAPIWVVEYMNGMGHEVYPVRFGKEFANKQYIKACKKIFETTGVILIGGLYSNRVELNPVHRVISEGDLGFVIAESAAEAAQALQIAVGGRRRRQDKFFAKSGIDMVERRCDDSGDVYNQTLFDSLNNTIRARSPAFAHHTRTADSVFEARRSRAATTTASPVGSIKRDSRRAQFAAPNSQQVSLPKRRETAVPKIILEVLPDSAVSESASIDSIAFAAPAAESAANGRGGDFKSADDFEAVASGLAGRVPKIIRASSVYESPSRADTILPGSRGTLRSMSTTLLPSQRSPMLYPKYSSDREHLLVYDDNMSDAEMKKARLIRRKQNWAALEMFRRQSMQYKQRLSPGVDAAVAGEIANQCFTRSESVSMEDVTVMRVDGMRDHIVVCGYDDVLTHLVPALRVKSLTTKIPVVFLSQEKMRSEVWEAIRIFEEIYIIPGDPSRIESLEAASAFTAKHVLIFPDQRYMTQSSLGDRNADVGSFMSLLCLDHHMPHAHNTVVTTLLNEQGNVKLMRPIRTWHDTSLKLTTLERRVAKSNEARFDYLNPSYAAGHVFSCETLSRFAAQSFFNPYAAGILYLMSSDLMDSASTDGDRKEEEEEDADSKRPRNHVFHKPLQRIKIPVSCVGNSFADLFKKLLVNDGMVAIALYRGVEGDRGNTLPYVYTCPERETVIGETDEVFVIG